MFRRGVYSGTMRRKLEAHKGGGTDLIEMRDRQGRYYHDSHQMNEQIYWRTAGYHFRGLDALRIETNSMILGSFFMSFVRAHVALP